MLIKEVFDQFLSEQKSKLAPKTYRDYESVIDLFENQLDGYAWNGIDDGEKAYDEAKKQKKSFIDLYDHTPPLLRCGYNLLIIKISFLLRRTSFGCNLLIFGCPP